MKVTVSDIWVKKREIELPDICPYCGVDFRVAVSAVSRSDLRPWSYEGRSQEGVFTPVGLDRGEGEDDCIEGLWYFCNACNHSLCNGYFSDIPKRREPLEDDEEEHEGH